MYKFEVWAPNAKQVAVQVDGLLHPMKCDKDGCWWADVEQVGPQSEYGFSLDGGRLLPDPRSPYQPNGINGLSRLVDHSRFKWSDAGWQAKPLSSALIYECHIGTFSPGGSYCSAIEKLDYLVELGVTHLEIMPVNEFSGKWGWGYDGVSLFAPFHHYGTPEDFKSLINACHAKGLAVILDVVYNHLGPVGNFLPEFGPYFTDAYHTPWGSAVNLDSAGSNEARQFFIDNALMWLRDYHLDGLRLDAIHALQDDSATHLLEQMSAEVDSLEAHLGRHLVLIAESDLNDPCVIRSRDAHGFGIDAQWSDDLHHCLHALLTGEVTGYYEDFGKFSHLATALKEAFVYNGGYSQHRGRRHGKRALGVSGHRFLAYSQNHDQIGNRAAGERLSQMISPGLQKIAAALVLTSPFVPMLFMGEEFSASTPFQYFTQHEDEELGQKVSEGRKSEFAAFGWSPDDVPDPQDPETFEHSKLNWDEVNSGHHAEMLAWYKELIDLRRQQTWLTNGRMDDVETCYSEPDRWFVMTRGNIEVVCNFSKITQRIPTKYGSTEVAAESVKINR